MVTYQELTAQIAHALQVPSSRIEDLETPTDEYGSFVAGNSLYTYDTIQHGDYAGCLKPGSIHFCEALQPID